MVSRREIVFSVGAVVLAVPLTAFTQPQPTKIPRIGYLQAVAPENNTSPFLEDFRRGLRELGYVEGRNLQLEVRW